MPDLPSVVQGDPHVTAHNDERALINAIKNLTSSEHTAALQALLDPRYILTGGANNPHLGLPMPANMRWRQDVLTVAIAGDFTVALGAPPINNVAVLTLKTGANNPYRLLPGTYTITGTTVVVPALSVGDKLVIEYHYDADAVANAASAVAVQPDLYDDFQRTVAATNVAANIGAANTGQLPYGIFGTPTYALDGNNLYKASPGGTPAQDCIYWDAGFKDGWIETVFAASSTTAAPSGLVVRGGNNSTMRIHSLSNGMSTRIAATDTRQFTSSQSFVPGDGCGVIANGANFKLYRRAGNTGPWVYIGEFTLPTSLSDPNPTLLTSTIVGLRGADTTTRTDYAYIKFIKNLTSPPAVL